ncbi:MAG: ribosome recycling factor, partial [bacterium]
MLADIRVEAYDALLPIFQVATIQVPDPRVIFIKAF